MNDLPPGAGIALTLVIGLSGFIVGFLFGMAL